MEGETTGGEAEEVTSNKGRAILVRAAEEEVVETEVGGEVEADEEERWRGGGDARDPSPEKSERNHQ